MREQSLSSSRLQLDISSSSEQALSGGGEGWYIIAVEIMAAIIAMATDIIDDKVTVFAISNIWFQGMDGGVQKGKKNRRTPSPSPLGEGARYQSLLSSSRLQPSSIVSSCRRHLWGGKGWGTPLSSKYQRPRTLPWYPASSSPRI